MKKVLSILLCITIIFTAFSVISHAEPEIEIKGNISDYPVIVIPGISASWLYLGDNPETGINAWSGMDISKLLPLLKEQIGQLAVGVATMSKDDADRIAKILADDIKTTWKYMAFNPDGTSKYDLKPYAFKPEETSTAYLDKLDYGFCIHDRENADIIADYIGEENIYNFNVDWRYGTEHCANILNEYVKGVKKLTGSDKVNIIATSQGGQIAAAYLTLFGDDMDANNVVLSSPAIGGSSLASDLLGRNVRVNEEGLMRMIEHGMYMEDDYEWLLKANELGFIDNIFNSLIPYLMNGMGYWGAVWDLVPSKNYETLKKQLLTSPENKNIIETSDRFHYEILPKVGEKFRELRKNGMNISIVTGTAEQVLTGDYVYSDGVINVETATGAYCARYGQRFEDGYTQKYDCNGKYKISPAMDIDASCAYLPDNTWFCESIYHGWTYFSECTKPLGMTLLLSDHIKDVYSDKDFPQFMVSDNLSKSIYFYFDNCFDGYLNSSSTNLVVKNVLKNSEMKIVGIYCDNLNLKFKYNSEKILEPGETVKIPFYGDIPKVSGKCIHVTVCYKTDTKTPLNYKTNGYTIMNGEKILGSNNMMKIEATTPFEKYTPGFIVDLFSIFGLKEVASLFSIIIYSYFQNIFK